MTKLLTTVMIVVGALGALAARAQAQPQDPGDLMDSGLASYQAGDYGAAIAAFRAAYAADERPAALFAMAQAERKAGDCATAVADYDRFLATAPAERQAQAARDQRGVCADQLAAAQAAAKAAEPVAPPAVEDHPAQLRLPPAPARADADADRGAAWFRDPLSDGLAGGAALTAAVGIGLTVASSHAARDANRADTYAAHASLADTASRDRTIAIVSYGGAAILGGALVWRIVRHRDEPDRERGVALVPGPGVGLAVAGGF